MALTVRFKPTGEIGTIPDNEFDPGIYEPIQQKSNFLADVGGYLARPFIDTAQNLGGAVEGLGLMAASPEFRKQQRGQTLTPKEAKLLASYKPAFEQTSINQTPGYQAGRTGKILAGLGSYAVPFGKGAGIVGKALVPGAAASGLLEASQPKATVGSTATAAGAGALFSGALYGLGKLIGASKKGLQKGGERLIQSQYNVPRSAGKALKIRETVTKLSDYGINNIDDIRPAAERVTGSDGVISRVVREAAGQADEVPTEGLLKIAQNLADDPSIAPGQDKKLFAFLKKGINSMYDTSGAAPARGANGAALLDYIRKLEGKAAGITRGRSSYMVPEADKALANAYLSFADELSGRLFQQGGADKIAVSLANRPEVLRELAAVSPKLAEAASKAQNVSQLRSLAAPFVRGAKLAVETEAGQNLATNTVAGAATGLGKMFQSPWSPITAPLTAIGSSPAVNAGLGGAVRGAGQAIPNVGGALTNPAALGAASRIGGRLGSILSAGQPQGVEPQGMIQGAQAAQPQQQNTEFQFDQQLGTYVSNDGQWAWDEQSQQWQPNQQAQQGQYPSQEAFKQAILQDLQTTGGKNISKIKTAMDIIYPAGGSGKPLGSAQAKNYDLARSGLRSLDTVEQLYNEDPSLLLKQLTPGKFFSRKFDSALFNAVDTLLRLRTGAQAPEQEIRRYMYSIGPTAGDNTEDVEFKIQQLRQTLQDAERSATTAPDTTLEDVLQNQQGVYGL